MPEREAACIGETILGDMQKALGLERTKDRPDQVDQTVRVDSGDLRCRGEQAIEARLRCLSVR